MTSPTKKTKPKTNKFFSLQTRRLAESFKGLNSSLAQSVAEIFPRTNTCKLLDFSLMEAKVLKNLVSTANHQTILLVKLTTVKIKGMQLALKDFIEGHNVKQ